jgi:hypothetical protein
MFKKNIGQGRKNRSPIFGDPKKFIHLTFNKYLFSTNSQVESMLDTGYGCEGDRYVCLS